MNRFAKLITAILLACTLHSNVLAQSDSSTQEQVFAPFARNLRIALKEPQIRITWEDTSNIASYYLIYRHTSEINSDNLSKAILVAELPASENYYIDIPPKAGTYFYAILIKTKENTVYEFLIPYRNKSISGVVLNQDPPQNEPNTEITQINAKVNGKTIQIQALSSFNTRPVHLYRSVTPISKIEDLANAVFIGAYQGSEIVANDEAMPGVAYYYAAADIGSIEKGLVTFVSGQNSLKNPIEIPLSTNTLAGIKLSPTRNVRSFPLPALNQISSENPLPSRNTQDLEPRLKEQVSKIINLKPVLNKPSELPNPTLLPSDRSNAVASRGHAASLREILKNSYSTGNYTKALSQLTDLMSLDLNLETKTKARYYTGICKALSGNERGAFLDLLVVRDQLAEYVNPWINAILSRLRTSS